MAKYDALFRHLCTAAAADDAIEMTFDQIEELVGPLPAGAARREWWNNDHTHLAAHTRAWLNAGRQVSEVDRAKRLVRFSAARWRRSS
jgi:hypothetical protein